MGGIKALAEFARTPASYYQIGVIGLTKLFVFLSQCLILFINKSLFSLIYVEIICKKQPQKNEKRKNKQIKKHNKQFR